MTQPTMFDLADIGRALQVTHSGENPIRGLRATNISEGEKGHVVVEFRLRRDDNPELFDRIAQEAK